MVESEGKYDLIIEKEFLHFCIKRYVGAHKNVIDNPFYWVLILLSFKGEIVKFFFIIMRNANF